MASTNANPAASDDGARQVGNIQCEPADNSLFETAIQRAVIRHLHQRGVPGLVFLHPANGGYRRRTEAAIFSGMGVRPGASDLLLWHAGRSYALELKTENGRPTKAQLAFLADMERAGAAVAIAHGLDSAIARLESWGLLHGRAAA